MTQQEIESMKLQAKQIRKSSDVTYCQALEALARNAGYNTWAGLLAGCKAEKGAAQ